MPARTSKTYGLHEPVDPRALVDHRTWVDGGQTLGEVFQLFSKHGRDFMAVLEGGRLLGLCCRRDIGMLLGGQYGFSLYAHKPVREHLHPNPVCVAVDTPLRQLFAAVFSRDGESFYDDVLLVDERGAFLGLIFTQTLVKLQNHLHLENIQLLERQRQEIDHKNKLIQADLRMARELQQTLLPDDYPLFPAHSTPQTSAFRFAHAYYPHDEVGGDFFYVKRIADSVAGVLIADVMGHGVRSAMVTAILRTMLEEMEEEFADPSWVLDSLNRGLSNILARTNNGVVYVTALYLVLDAATFTVRFASAGHPLPLHLRPHLGQASLLDHPDPGLVLGLLDDVCYQTVTYPYAPGDRLVLYTDGLIEAANRQGEPFGEHQMIAAIAPVMARNAADIIRTLLESARAFAENQAFSDDVCVVAVELQTWPVLSGGDESTASVPDSSSSQALLATSPCA